MSSFPEKLENFKIELDEKRILRLIGYKKKPSEKESFVKKLILEEKKKLDHLLHPAALYTIIDYEETDKHPVFKDAEKIAFCICTIGPELEEKTSRLMSKNELLRALILDTLGSESAEEVAVQSDRRIAQEAREMGLWPSKRFSPGYGNWTLEKQKFIFGVLPADQIGVRLHEDSWMMIPRKSVSFRINFYKKKEFSTRKKI